MVKPDSPGPLLMTIGHSTRPIEEFIDLLKSNGVQRLVDVRTIPRSRHNPQFNRDSLPKSLEASGIAYTHLKDLGGLRKPKPDSLNTGWRNASFRGFADYMQTPEFEAALKNLLQLAETRTCAIMCAEAVPWRCHRSLIADALLARHIPVEHIVSGPRRQSHELTPFAKVRGTQVTYPAHKDQRESSKKTARQLKLIS
jgi:uncharacterized protein (DUF488 family)